MGGWGRQSGWHSKWTSTKWEGDHRKGKAQAKPYVVCVQCGNWCFTHKQTEACIRCQSTWPTLGQEAAPPKQFAQENSVAQLRPDERLQLEALVLQLQQFGMPTEQIEQKLRVSTTQDKVVNVAPAKAFNVARAEEAQAEAALQKAQKYEQRLEANLEEARAASKKAKDLRDQAAAKRAKAFAELSADEVSAKAKKEQLDLEAQRQQAEMGEEDALLAEVAEHQQDQAVAEAKRALAETIRQSKAGEAKRRRRSEKQSEKPEEQQQGGKSYSEAARGRSRSRAPKPENKEDKDSTEANNMHLG